MNYRISFSADTDIERICDRIAEDNPGTANRLDEQIHQAIQLLAEFPGMGHSRADVKDKRYLFWVVGSYVIAYRGRSARPPPAPLRSTRRSSPESNSGLSVAK